ncbi:MAG TPA: hypothetical protein VGM33_25920 [Baekduia sp.]
MRSRLPLLLALTLVAAALPAASADAYIYWVNEGTHAIARADNDGTDVDLSFITGLPAGVGIYPDKVAVNGTSIFWTNSQAKTIGRAKLDGSAVNQSFLTTTGSSLSAIAADDAHVYWSQGHTIGRADVSGANPTPALVTLDEPGGSLQATADDLALTPSSLYWARNGYGADASYGIGRAGLDGAGAGFVRESVDAPAIAADAAHVYSVELQIGTVNPPYPIRISGPDRASPAVLVAGDNYKKSGLAVDGCHVYWTVAKRTGTGATTGAIGRANIDGTAVQQGFVPESAGVDTPGGVAVDRLGPGGATCTATTGPTDPVITAPVVVVPPYVPPGGPVPPLPPQGPIVDHGLTQAQLDQLAVSMLGYTLPPPTTVAEIFDTPGLPSFSGSLEYALTWTACTSSCLGSPGGTVTHAALPLERVGIAAAAAKKSNVIAATTYTTPVSATPIDYPTSVARLTATGKVMKSLTKDAASTTKLKAKLKHAPAARRKAIKKQLSTLARRRKASLATLKRLGVTLHALKTSAAGRTLLKALRKKVKAHKKTSIVLRLTVTNPTTHAVSTHSKTVRITG